MSVWLDGGMGKRMERSVDDWKEGWEGIGVDERVGEWKGGQMVG